MRISDWSSDVCSSDLNLRHWRITGIPQAVCDLYSKRADEIDAYLAEAGHTSYRARSVAARDTRSVKRHTGADELLPHWPTELPELGWRVERPATAPDTRSAERRVGNGASGRGIFGGCRIHQKKRTTT